MEEFDVVVVGGGPGGATVATLVAMQGHRTLLLEKEHLPRYQIGESLLPSTVHGVCRLTGAWDLVKEAGFTKKRGGTFRWGANPQPWTFTFSISSKMAGQTSFAYQVERMKFDQILVRNAERKGVTVREGCTVTRVLSEAERVSGLEYVDDGGATHRVNAKFVVDASGNGSRLHTHVGERRYSEFFRNLALFGYFENGKRLPEPNSGNILSAAFDSGWFWYIPLTPTLTSVGAVVNRELAAKVQGDPEKALMGLIRECPLIADFLSSATRVTSGPYGKLRVRKDYSYHTTKFWRPGMVLVGDAACFVDPVFSSGVHLATYSALLAARSINSVLTGGIDETTAFTEFERRYRREYGLFYEFLISFYDMHHSEDSYFWNAKKVTASELPELESFVELVGGVASTEARIVQSGVEVGTAEVAQRIANGSAEFTDALEKAAAEDEGAMLPLLKSAVAGQALRESSEIQAQAMYGVDAENELPLFEDGLIVSPDGMSWSHLAAEVPHRSAT
ncbi:tryptophan 7-halogenase [Amycolatopsis sp. cg9]|uniref:tryptophan 7-halogenase n=1 Tax=Amycolatopsis sp. cg9 TaxID=3238801 RepID=UPI00352483E3